MPTLGEYRIGIDFNPGGSSAVAEIKRRAADFIDLVENMRGSGAYEVQEEVHRLISLAQTHIEDAAMWGVKAVTKPKRE